MASKSPDILGSGFQGDKLQEPKELLMETKFLGTPLMDMFLNNCVLHEEDGQVEQEKTKLGNEIGEENTKESLVNVDTEEQERQSSYAEDEDQVIIDMIERNMEDFIKNSKQIPLKVGRSITSISLSTKITVVAEKIRILNEDAYSPRLLQFGPLTYYGRNQSGFRAYKEVSMQRYLHTTSNVKVKDIATMALKYETIARSHYDIRTNEFETKSHFTEMNIKDSITIIELLLDNADYNPYLIVSDARTKRDIMHDMILLENQISCHLLKELFALRGGCDNIPLYKWAHRYFKDVGNMATLPAIDYPYDHLLDFLREYHCPTHDGRVFNYQGVALAKKSTHSAKELQMSGIKLRKETNKNKQLLDINFNAESGILTIPQLILNEFSETFYLNLIALEQSNRQKTQYICSYFIFMENLAKNPKDVDLLVEHQIIKNSFGDSEKIRQLFANIRQNIELDGWEFCFNDLYHDLNHYKKSYCHRLKGSCYQWKKMLRQDYFNSPWSTISVVAATILLILTVVQTACSIISIV